MAEGVFRKLVEEAGCAEHVEVDSAGTHAYHTQEPPDPRAQAAAAIRMVRNGRHGPKARTNVLHANSASRENRNRRRRLAQTDRKRKRKHTNRRRRRA